MATPTTSGDEIMSLLLADIEEEEEDAPAVVEAVLSLDDVTVEVDQYAPSEPQTDDGGEPVPDSFEFIGSEGPTLSSTVTAQEEEEDVELTSEDAPKEYIAFELGDTNPLDEVDEPVHTGKGSLYSPTVATPNDDDLLGEVGPTLTEGTPDLPDLPDDPPLVGDGLAQAVAVETPSLPEEIETHSSPTDTRTETPPSQPSTPALPDLPEDEDVPAQESEPTQPQETAPVPADQDRIWPWPKADAWTPTQVYHEVVTAMEHIKHGRMEQAANTLDNLGPHLDLNLDMLLHISVLMQHLGRHEHVKWTLDMAAYVHPNNAHVQQARAQLLA